MAATALLQSASAKSFGTLREVLGVNNQKEKIPPDLQYTLRKLKINSLDELEKRFLSVEAFLRPWSIFRDNVLFLHPDAMSRPTLVGTTMISRADILWFYTQFDEGMLRYDSRADPARASFTSETRVYGLIDKSNWGLEEHEKHLFAWLLQSFKVGKARNPMGLHYLELKSVCTIWEEIFVPIVNAVRVSYNRGGRAHYGRFARLIEQICPSGLAFPDSNVGTEGDIMSPTPFRIVSVPRQFMHNIGSTETHNITHRTPFILKKRHYDETERELRDVYPQYGGLVERPKFKQKMEEWLGEQRSRAEHRKQLEGGAETIDITTTELHVSKKRDGIESPMKRMLTPLNFFKHTSVESRPRSDSNEMSQSPIKRHSNRIRRSLSSNLALKNVITQDVEQKSPLHGVTRQLYFSDNTPLYPEDLSGGEESMPSSSRRPEENISSEQMTIRPEPPQTRAVSTDGHNANDTARVPSTETVSVLGSQPLHHQHPASRLAQQEVRQPSYEGTGYQDEISLTDLHAARSHAARSTQPPAPVRPPTRIPAPISIVPYSGNTRVASGDSQPNSAVKTTPHTGVAYGLQSIARMPDSSIPSHRIPSHWANKSPPKAIPWPGTQSIDDFGAVRDEMFDFGIDNNFTPPVPSKSPERQNVDRQRKIPCVNQLSGHEANSVHRIVSIENIRSALDSDSNSSLEELVHRTPFARPTPTASPVRSLRTYNSHHFPRKAQD